MAEELKITLKVDTQNAERGFDKVSDALDETKDKVEDAQDSLDSAGDSADDLASRLKKATWRWTDASSKLSGGVNKGTVGFKALKVAGVAAVAAIAIEVAKKLVEALKPVWDAADEMAKMFDPQKYAQSATALDKSVKRIKTTLGSFTAPVVNAIKNGLAKIVDGLNSLLERSRIMASFMSGLITSVFEPVVNALKMVVAMLKNAINSLTMMLGLGKVFKDASKSAKDASKDMETVAENVSAGLASFDKLNTLDVSNMGDAEQAEELVEDMAMAKSLGDMIGDKIKETLGGVWDFITNLDLGQVWEDFKSSASDAWSSVTSWATETWTNISSYVSGVWEGIKSMASDLWSRFIGWATGGWDWVKTKAVEIWNNIKEYVVQKFTDAKTAILGIFTSLWSGVKSAWDTVYGAIRSAIDWILSKVEWIMGKVNAAKNAVSNIGGGIVSGIKGGVSNLVSGAKNLLGLASGGAIAPNDPKPYLLGDNTREYEVVSPVSLMKSAFKEAMAEMGGKGSGGSSGAVDITLNIDGKKLARMTYDSMENERKRRNEVSA